MPNNCREVARDIRLCEHLYSERNMLESLVMNHFERISGINPTRVRGQIPPIAAGFLS